jgi:hypothetical protein
MEREFQRIRCRPENTIKMHLKEIRNESVDGIRLAEDRDLWWSLMCTV